MSVVENQFVEISTAITALGKAFEHFVEQNGGFAAERKGLIGYEGLRHLLAIDGKPMSLRAVQGLAAKHRRILRRVKLGHRQVGFRPADVEKLKAHLAGDLQLGGGL